MDLPEIEDIERAFPEILAEAMALGPELFVSMPSQEQVQGTWTAFLLRAGPWEHEYPGVDFVANRARCPRTMALVESLPGARVAGFLRLEAGAELRPHRDHRDDHEVRAHLALHLPEEERQHWPVGRVRLLDVRELHGAKNPSSEPRLTFTVDLLLPFPVTAGMIPPWSAAG